MGGEGGEGEVTRLLARAREGDAGALDAAYAAVYGELKRAAHLQLRRHRDAIETTALVHEAYLKLVGGAAVGLNDRHHLLALSARRCARCWWIMPAPPTRRNAVVARRT